MSWQCRGGAVLTALAQRRDLQRKHRELMEKVQAGAARLNFPLQFAVRCRDHPYVHAARGLAQHGQAPRQEEMDEVDCGNCCNMQHASAPNNLEGLHGNRSKR